LRSCVSLGRFVLIHRAKQQHRVISQALAVFELYVNVYKITRLRVDIDRDSLLQHAVLLKIMLRERTSADLHLTSGSAQISFRSHHSARKRQREIQRDGLSLVGCSAITT
jgi:hypothetical protein